jgi:hypothetical protein
LNCRKLFDARIEAVLTKKQIKEALAIHLAMAGSVSSPAKARAARANGKLGGRPRKKNRKRK